MCIKISFLHLYKMKKYTKVRKSVLFAFCLSLPGLSYGMSAGSETIVFKNWELRRCAGIKAGKPNEKKRRLNIEKIVKKKLP